MLLLCEPVPRARYTAYQHANTTEASCSGNRYPHPCNNSRQTGAPPPFPPPELCLLYYIMLSGKFKYVLTVRAANHFLYHRGMIIYVCFCVCELFPLWIRFPGS